MSINNQLSAELNLSLKQVDATMDLIDQGNTIPFIARYRKEVTGGISDEVLRDFDERLKYLRNLEQRKEEVIRVIEEQGKLTDTLKTQIESARVLQKVEDLYRPFKQKKSTRASKAIDRDLTPLADAIWTQNYEKDFDQSFEAYAASFINVEKEVNSVEEAIAGAMDIIAERISDDANFREWIRKNYFDHGVIESKAVDAAETSVYDMYNDYSEGIKKIVNHRILAINRGEKEKVLKVKLITSDEACVTYLKDTIIKTQSVTTPHLSAAIDDAYKRLIAPSIEREIRSMLTERAENEAIQVFGKNTKSLLLVSPVKDVRILAVDPSFRTGCKLAVLDETGKLLDYATIYPNAPQNEVEPAKAKMKTMIQKYNINVISIGNGTASRETEQIVAEMIRELDQPVDYTIVSEAGASVYSASKLATDEYPDINVSIRGAISIGRRLQDPLAELVKIDPKSIGVGQYQHDVNQKKLEDQLKNVVEDCVNSVGVDLNTATPSLLGYVSGISGTISKNIVMYRDGKGKFDNRRELLKVKGLGPKAFEQCAGFLRIPKAINPLDNTAVHPESYEVTQKLLDKLGYSTQTLNENELKNIDLKIAGLGEIKQAKKVSSNSFDELKAFNKREMTSEVELKLRFNDGIKKLSNELGIGELTLRDIVEEVKKPGRDPREDMPKPIFRSDVLKMEDLRPDMILTGTVRNVVDFGAFVDIGVKQDGLVHISQICNEYIKHPMQKLSVGETVTVKIISIDLNKQKISLTMKDVE